MQCLCHEFKAKMGDDKLINNIILEEYNKS